MSDSLLDKALTALQGAGTSMRCDELTGFLESLGFQVREGRKGGHRIYFHPGLPDFASSSFNCDHGRNPQI